uniref:Uncharacterized protein n=2 Tax=Xiphophorus TaxID=8082 RepID=A0A3B5R8V4_XIPMA
YEEKLNLCKSFLIYNNSQTNLFQQTLLLKT